MPPLKRRANRLAAATARATVAAAQVAGRSVANVARACAGSSACRTAAVGVAVAAVAVACTACAVGAAIGTGIGGGVGLATCGGDAGCVARSAVAGARSSLAPSGGSRSGGLTLSACIQPRPPAGVIVHPYQGCQYISHDFVALAAELGITLSLGRKASAGQRCIRKLFRHLPA